MARPVRLILALTLSTLTLPAPASAGGQVEVLMAGTQFLPSVTQVPAGQGVTWTNKDVMNYPVVLGNHNVIPDQTVGTLPGNKPFPPGGLLLQPGKSWSCTRVATRLKCVIWRKLVVKNVKVKGKWTKKKVWEEKAIWLTPGRYAYACGIHPNQMRGLLVVE
ncbi:MAG: hypothetical protein HY775_00740 [Acidobacteria bacterium]|nr:hypothetical protein [Acidobacteriota bacterium]